MTKTKKADQYSDKETEKRMAAALRGARLVGHKPMSEKPKAKAKKKIRRERTS